MRDRRVAADKPTPHVLPGRRLHCFSLGGPVRSEYRSSLRLLGRPSSSAELCKQATTRSKLVYSKYIGHLLASGGAVIMWL